MSEDKPRYSRNSDILDLAVFMSSRMQGVTIKDIMERYNISRRTAERMRDSLTCIFSHVVELDEIEDTQKHWGFDNYSIAQLISFSPEEIASIAQFKRRTTSEDLKLKLEKVIEKLKALNKKNSVSMEQNIELIMQTEGYAIRQMPQYKIDLNVLEFIRNALRESKMVSCVYHDKQRLLEPLGLIYGEKIYLVAREKAKGDGVYNFLLHKFQDLKLTDKSFDRGDFSLKEYNKLSFGLYHGEIMNVKLSFSPKLAPDAKKYNFHPTQKMKEENDGSLTVTFKASGSREIIWHIFKWGEGCKIVSPKSLRQEYINMLETCTKAQKG